MSTASWAPQTGEVHQPPPQNDDCPSWPLADRGRGRRRSWTRDHQLHDKPDKRTPRTNPDWPRLLLHCTLRGVGQGRGVDGHTGSCTGFGPLACIKKTKQLKITKKPLKNPNNQHKKSKQLKNKKQFKNIQTINFKHLKP